MVCTYGVRVGKRDVIHIFLGSPGDVESERDAARAVVNEVNQQLASKFGLQLDLYGWEQQPPSYGRPQEQINARVDEADLFIGVLWRKWGTPPGEEYTSGFQEEYRRACDRRAASQSLPEVWLFFKEVDEEQRNDAGPELRQVLDFREQVESEREALFHTFSDEQEWRTKLYGLLVGYVSDRVQNVVGDDEPTGTPTTGEDPGDQPPARRAEDSDESLDQLVEALTSSAEAVRRGGHGPSPDVPTSARVLLASFLWLSQRTTSEVLGTHEQNVLFRLRETLAPTIAERIMLVRSMLTGGDLRPGWFWLAKASAPAALLADLARGDRNSGVRYHAAKSLGDLSALESLGEDFDQLRPAPFLKELCGDKDAAVRNVGFEAAAAHASSEAFELLLANEQSARASLVRALLRRAPEAALEYVLGDRAMALVLGDELEAHASDYSSETLRTMCKGEDVILRDLGIKLAGLAGVLEKSQADEVMRNDSADFVRRTALDAALDAGWTIEQSSFDAAMKGHSYGTAEADERRYQRYFNSRDQESLRAQANWYLPRGHYAYMALVQCHPNGALARAQRDLDDGFQQFQAESKAAVDERFGEGAADSLRTPKTAARDFALAALRGLRANATAEHTTTVERYLLDQPDESLQMAALAVIAKVAPAAAATRATAFALDAKWGDKTLRQQAAQLALDAAPQNEARELSESAEASVAQIAIPALGNGEAADALLRKLLHCADDDVRVAALRALVAGGATAQELMGLMAEYVATDGVYYYNVVTWLDRLVFAPEPFRGHYRRQLLDADTASSSG